MFGNLCFALNTFLLLFLTRMILLSSFYQPHYSMLNSLSSSENIRKSLVITSDNYNDEICLVCVCVAGSCEGCEVVGELLSHFSQL